MVSQVEALAEDTGCVVYDTDTTRDIGIGQAFLALVSGIAMRLPDPLDPSLLLGCHLRMGL